MTKAEDAEQWLSQIDLAAVFAMLQHNGVTEILYKVLPQNANSKNQVYLASDLSQLGKIPSGEVAAHQSISSKNGRQEAVFRSALEFYWLDQGGQMHLAPKAQLIFYPQYPEVRLSGFLQGCRNPPTSLWVKGKRGEVPNRILLIGLGNGRKVIAVTLPPESPAAKEILAAGTHETYGALGILPMPGQREDNGYLELMRALCSIHRRAWVPSTRLDREGRLIRCNAHNCNGNTLESLLGIRSNGFSLPDFRGWEVKARQVANVDKPGSSTVTLFTPEPTDGIYTVSGVAEFVRRFGYADTRGRDDRLNFGGIYRVGKPPHQRTGLRLVLDGFNPDTKKFTSSGSVQLLDSKDNVAAAWAFAKLLDHWKVKHAHAAFVPSQLRTVPDRQYRYSQKILLGVGAEFGLLLNAIHEGKVYYDPASSSKLYQAKNRNPRRVASSA